jgi:hypothetical protein
MPGIYAYLAARADPDKNLTGGTTFDGTTFDQGHLCIILLNLNDFLSNFEKILNKFNKLSGALCPHQI